LIVSIEDNGVGRRESAKYKSKNVIQYQSKGMSLTANRIEMLNRKNESKMQVLVEDLEENHLSRGTRVTIRFQMDEEDGEP
jgi:hypothetical protein